MKGEELCGIDHHDDYATKCAAASSLVADAAESCNNIATLL